MNRQEILELQSTCGFPSISLLMPTLRKHPESRQNKTNLKNLAAGVKHQLNGNMDEEHKAAILNRLDEAIEAIDFEHPAGRAGCFC